MSEEDIRNLQSTGGDHLAATQKNILGNDIDKVWDHLKDSKNGRIDFVLDNAGFELFTDLVLADFLLQSGLASQIKFHGKRFAWFVSDVTVCLSLNNKIFLFFKKNLFNRIKIGNG